MDISIEAVLESFRILLGLRSETETLHGQRVASIALQFGEQLGMAVDVLENLRITALLHDIGKVGVLGSVITKAGPLTRGEWAMVKKHPQFSYDVLHPLGLDPSVEIGVLEHQENYDGTGYPDGKSGEGISLIGRILRIADTYQSLTENRPYRRGFSHEKAIEIMWQSQTNFDPLLLDLFSHMERRSE